VADVPPTLAAPPVLVSAVDVPPELAHGSVPVAAPTLLPLHVLAGIPLQPDNEKTIQVTIVARWPKQLLYVNMGVSPEFKWICVPIDSTSVSSHVDRLLEGTGRMWKATRTNGQ
jgi:hypothetical protein